MDIGVDSHQDSGRRFSLLYTARSEVTAPTASGTDEGSNENIAADAEVKDPEQQQQEASKTPSLPKRRKQIGGETKDWVKVKEWVNPTIYPARTRMATRKLLSSTSGGATTEQQEQAQGEDASSTLRVLLAVAAVRKWKVKQMDIVTVFLYGIVEEELVDTSAWWEVGL
ncbi:hypothetical protein CLOP_g14315 [Closterium sp. NIES-67]|nr:hypothetical protein CLOP_g14315 [Closterium sp. NIES-67]